MLNYTLGTIEASEALIKDLYIDLRAKVNAWSKITQQTPQARMGYVGQHLVSVVTGYPGGKSGARGYDLVIDDERHGEINIKNVIKKYSPSARVNGLNKEKLLQLLEDIRKTNNITNADLCNKFADEICLTNLIVWNVKFKNCLQFVPQFFSG